VERKEREREVEGITCKNNNLTSLLTITTTSKMASADPQINR